MTPTSVAATQASDGFKGYMDSVNQVQTADPATLPPGAPLLVEGDANALLMRWHTTQLALERAQCAAVTSDMLYAEGYEGQLRGGGMFGVQCGEGPAAQNRGEPSTGRYLLLARTPGDGGDLGAAYQPSLLAFCGPFRVCARPAVRR